MMRVEDILQVLCMSVEHDKHSLLLLYNLVLLQDVLITDNKDFHLVVLVTCNLLSENDSALSDNLVKVLKGNKEKNVTQMSV